MAQILAAPIVIAGAEQLLIWLGLAASAAVVGQLVANTRVHSKMKQWASERKNVRRGFKA